MDKKISVIITCHPPVERFLEECVLSVKGQTCQPHEIIIVLDSYDKPLIFKDTTTIVRTQNLGVAKSRDQGVTMSTGDYLLFLDADDALPENFIEEMAKVDADIVYPNTLLWSYWSERPLPNQIHYSPKVITEQAMLKFNQVVVTSLMRRKVYEKVGPFEDLPVFEDYKFFLKALKARFKFKPANCYLKYRQRQDSRNHQSDELRRRIYREILDWYKYAKV